MRALPEGSRIIGMDDWWIFAAAPDGRQWMTNTELWGVWGDYKDTEAKEPAALAVAEAYLFDGEWDPVEPTTDGLPPDCWRGEFPFEWMRQAAAPWDAVTLATLLQSAEDVCEVLFGKLYP